MTDPLLRVEGMTKTYRRRGTREQFVALEAFDLDLDAAASVAIVGESGSGKSTAARIVTGLELPTAGSVSLNGRFLPQRRLGYRERRWRSSVVQMVFQDPLQSLDRRQSVADCLHESLWVHGDRSAVSRNARIADLLASVGLEDRHAAALPLDLSGGQRQRVAIARALAPRPRLLVLDEAVSALDVSIQAQVLNLLTEIRADQGIALLFISHDMGVVGHISDDVVVMRRGRVEERGTVASVLDNPASAYTRDLLSSVPRPGWVPRRARDRAIAASDTA